MTYLNIPVIRYEGRDSKNPLAFRWYDPDEVIEGRTMRDHFRFSVVFWHTFRGTGADPFGAPTIHRAWDDGSDSLDNALRRVDVAFEFMDKLNAPFFAFHDRDIAPERSSLAETNAHLDRVVDHVAEHMQQTGIGLLWGTANLFSHPRYMHGAGTSCDAESFAFAAAQIKKCLEVTHRLNGDGYVFWGGREGYQNLFNTDMRRELDNFARLLHMAVDYARQLGFQGQLLIEPKPKEPTKHQYDSDVAACLNFLRAYDLKEHFKLNIETNHATLAGHTMMHELQTAAIAGALGSIDANTGDLLLGWDTDQFPTDIYLTTQIMLVLLQHGGLGKGGVNFDAKLRRESIDVADMFHAHIGGMDTFARGLKIAAAIRADGELDRAIKHRYRSWDSGLGAEIEADKHTLDSLERYMLEQGEVSGLESGRQEYFENLINRFI